MSKLLYPVKCGNESCGKDLYGPVVFCPFCGKDFEEMVPPVREEKTKILEQSKQDNDADGTNDPPDEEPTTYPNTTKIIDERGWGSGKNNTAQPKKSNRWKWIIPFALLLAVIAFYMFWIGGDKEPQPTPPSTPEKSEWPVKTITEVPVKTVTEVPVKPVRKTAVEALDACIGLSVSVTKLSNEEEVLKKARNLMKINIRYKPQFDLAKKTVASAYKKRDEKLMRYFDNLHEMRRYPSDRVSGVLKNLREGAQTSRKRAGATLLAEQVITLRKNPNADPKQLLPDFTKRFSKFID